MDFWIRSSSFLHYLASSQRVSSMDDRYAVRDVREERGFLHRRISAPYCHNVFAFEEESITGRTAGDSSPPKLRFRREPKPLGVCTGGDDHALALVRLPASDDTERSRGEVNECYVIVDNPGPELLRLATLFLDQSRS